MLNKRSKYKIPGLPKAQGLYNPSNEHDACGVGMVLDIQNRASYDIVEKGLAMLCNLEHRGAVGADPRAGDGSGLLIQIPHKFLKKKTSIPSSWTVAGNYAVGVIFMPKENNTQEKIKDLVKKTCLHEEINILGWRLCPTHTDDLGWSVLPSTPDVFQLFLERPDNEKTQDDFERKLYILRRCIEESIVSNSKTIQEGFYIPSLSSRTILYKGMVLADQVGGIVDKLGFYDDLSDSDIESSFAIIHQRFSTNTAPSWHLAQPFRMLAHNGEINTVRGNINWMNARRKNLASPLFKEEDLEKIWPIIEEGQSDTASFDNALELLVMGGYSIAEAMLIMIPEAWEKHNSMTDEKKAFYKYNSCIMEPWDGPASIPFTDGKYIGALLDRNGLRPSRYTVTKDGYVVMSSETGVVDLDPENILSHGRLEPGKMFLVDMDEGRIINDKDIKQSIANKKPWKKLLELSQIEISDLPENNKIIRNELSQKSLQKAFGYTQEDEKFLLNPMAESGMEATGSMGTDTPIAPLSLKSKLMFSYFKQKFAQVTNPPIDPIREEMVMSINNFVGPRANVLDLDHKESLKYIKLETPILDQKNANKIVNLSKDNNSFLSTKVIDITYKPSENDLKSSLEKVCSEAEKRIIEGYYIIVLIR